MNKTISMSIRVSKEELDKLKQAARLEAYASYSEFIRRTALIEAENVLKKTRKEKTSMIDQNNFSRVPPRISWKSWTTRWATITQSWLV